MTLLGLRRGRCHWCLQVFLYKPQPRGFPKHCCSEHAQLNRLRSNRESKKRNAEKYKPVKQAWNERNREKIRLRAMEKLNANRFIVQIKQKKWRFKNRERLRAKRREWMAQNPDKVAVYREKKRLDYHLKKQPVCNTIEFAR